MKNRNRSRGTSTVELAVAAPLLLLMMAGAADFARIFYHAITVDNASEAGALYGAQNGVMSADYGGIEQVAKDDAADLDGVTASPTRSCDCPDQATKECFDNQDCTGTYEGVSNYGLPRAYVELEVEQTFKPLLPWPGIPNPVGVAEKTYMRVR